MARSARFAFAWFVPLAACACTDGTIVNAGLAPELDSGIRAPVDSGRRVLPDGAVVGAHSVGEACADDAASRCRSGLVCTAGKCDFGHTAAAGDPCVAAGECQDGLQCAGAQCAPAGTGDEGSSCLLDTDCKTGLRCGIVGFGAQCVTQGASDVGQTCGTSGDCYAGLICAPSLPTARATGDAAASSAATACAPIPPTGGVPFGIPVPPALQCEKEDTTGTVKAYFEVPGATDTPDGGDFFRMPFPNDARIKSGKIDFSGFPTPGSALLGFDPVQTYLDAIAANETAWGTYATALFRFSGPVDFSSFQAAPGEPSPVNYLDITDPQNPTNAGAQWGYNESAGKYICHNWFSVRRPRGVPLEPGHTYAVYLSAATSKGPAKGVKGGSILQAPELAALLGPVAPNPSDKALAAAYVAYAPFRAYMKAQGIAAKTVLNAAVFTAGQVRAPMEKLAAAALAAPAPTAAKWVKCGGGATSPCSQADGTRACGKGTADYDEYQALVSIPIFQKGTAPYLASGGNIDSTSVARTEAVCVSLTVPKKATPATGWPVVVFAHGTGGSFRDHVRNEVAGALARATPAMAVLGYDQVQHGPRRGASTASPNELFFNFKNPAAARGNPMQGGADVISMGRFAKALSVPAAVAGGTAIDADPKAIVFFGHSQGSMHGSLGLPYTNDYSAAVLSGNGASLMNALLTKTQPQNIAQAVPFALGADYDAKRRLFGGENHPVLSILQQWIDPADPLNFGAVIGRSPATGITPKSVFQTYGLGDTFSPPVTLQTYAVAAQLDVATHDPSVATPDDIGGFAENATPLSGTTGNPKLTLAVREYQNAAGKDGHFVVFDVASANADMVRFLSMAAAGQVPAVGK